MIWTIAGLLLALGIVNCLLLAMLCDGAGPRRGVYCIGYPATQFAFLWALVLASIGGSGGYFHNIASGALEVYILGVVSIAIGGFVGLCAFPPLTNHGPDETIWVRSVRYKILWGASGILAAGCWSYWERIVNLAANPEYSNFWIAVRAATLEAGDRAGQKTLDEFLFDNAPVVAILIALSCCVERRNTIPWRILMGTSVVLCLFYTLMSGSRSGAMALVLGVFGICLIRQKRLSWRPFLAVCCAVVAVYVPAAVVMEKGGSLEDSAMQNVLSVTDSLRFYALSGPVAFSDTIEDPRHFRSTWTIGRSLHVLGSRLGLEKDFETAHAAYTDVGNGRLMNIYTLYYSYYTNYGVIGTCTIMFLLGVGLTGLFVYAASGYPEAQMMYGIGFGGIMLSCFNEQFFMNLSLWMKCAAWCIVFFTAIRWSGTRRRSFERR